MKKVLLFAVATAAVLVALHPGRSAATSLNINFGTYSGPGQGALPDTYGSAAGQAGYWNTINTTGVINLDDLGGSALPGVTLTLSSVSFGYAGGPTYNYPTDDRRLVQGNFFSGSSWSTTLAGLDNGLYDLYVYGPANVVVNSSAFTVNGVTQSNLVTNGGNSLVEGTDYEIVQVLVSDNSIGIGSGAKGNDFSGNPAGFSGLAGLQLVSLAPSTTPLPATLPLFGSGVAMIALLIMRRRKPIARRMG